MLNKIGLAAVILVAGAAPSFADDSCQAPPMPVAVDGATVATDALRAAIKGVNDYQGAVDTYQKCIADYITAQKAQADKDKKPIDAAIIQTEGDKVTASNASKQKAVDAINAAIGDYKKAHPKPAG
jgi:hypothetical protein